VLKLKLSKNVYIEAQTIGPAGNEYILKRDEMPIDDEVKRDEIAEEESHAVEDCAKNDETASAVDGAADGNTTPNSQDVKTSPPSVQSDEMSGTSTVVN